MRLLATIAAALALAPAAAADPGVTDTSVKLGGTVPLSGPAAAFGVVGPGAAAYFAYVNDHGGVNGRKIDYEYLDDGYDPTQSVQLSRKLIQQDGVFALFNTIGTENAIAVRPIANQLHVPMLFAGTGVTSFDDPKHYPWSMPYLPSNVAEGAIDGRTILARFPKAKVAVLVENDQFGKDLLAGLKSVLPARKITDVEGYELTDTDVTAQVSKLRATGANTFVCFATPAFVIRAFLAAAKLGWHPQFFVSSVSIEPTIMKIVSASTSPAYVEGALSIAFVKDPTNLRVWGKDPAVGLYRRIMAQYDPQGRPSDVYNFYGMAVAFTMVDVLKHAGRNLTRESLMQAATHLVEANNPFLLPGIVLRTSPSDYFPMKQAGVYRYHKGFWAPDGPLVPARSP